MPKLVVGLGNPGEEYQATRHNIGFEVVAGLAARRGLSLDRIECNARVARDEELWLAQPLTYMNRSGFALRCLMERHGLGVEDVLVVYDEIHLALGRIRLRPRGSAAGHRGLESILENLQSPEVGRLRLGVGPQEEEVDRESLVDFVLAPFASEESELVTDMTERAVEACLAWARDGMETAMNRFNG